MSVEQSTESRRNLAQWLRHAFAVEPRGAAQPTEPERTSVEAVCRQVVRRGMSVPVSFSLELFRPLNFIGAQAMHVLAPFVALSGPAENYRQFAAFLEKRGSIDYLLQRIEELQRQSEGPSAEAIAPKNSNEPPASQHKLDA